MKRALVSPLLSLFMPGLGQIMNRQAGKGAALVMGVSVIFMVTLGLFVHKFSKAAMAITEAPHGGDTFAQLHKALLAQGLVWLLVMAAIYLAVLAYAVTDAWRKGREIDRGRGSAA